jgi:hypothetical protein
LVNYIEYCTPCELLKREKDYIDLLLPEYNIIQNPTLPLMSGRTHSEETRKKMTASQLGNNNALGFKHSEEARTSIGAAKLEVPLSEKHKLAISLVQSNCKKNRSY